MKGRESKRNEGEAGERWRDKKDVETEEGCRDKGRIEKQERIGQTYGKPKQKGETMERRGRNLRTDEERDDEREKCTGARLKRKTRLKSVWKVGATGRRIAVSGFRQVSTRVSGKFVSPVKLMDNSSVACDSENSNEII